MRTSAWATSAPTRRAPTRARARRRPRRRRPRTTSSREHLPARVREVPIARACLPARDLQPEVDPSPVGTKLPASETRPAERSHKRQGNRTGGRRAARRSVTRGSARSTVCEPSIGTRRAEPFRTAHEGLSDDETPNSDHISPVKKNSSDRTRARFLSSGARLVSASVASRRASASSPVQSRSIAPRANRECTRAPARSAPLERRSPPPIAAPRLVGRPSAPDYHPLRPSLTLCLYSTPRTRTPV